METLKLNGFSIQSDDRTVWIHRKGETIARFGVFGIDIHRPIADQLNNDPPCLYCTHGKTLRADWDVFVQKIKELYGIDIPQDVMPTRFKD